MSGPYHDSNTVLHEPATASRHLDVTKQILEEQRPMTLNEPSFHPIYGKPIEILLVEDNDDEASLTIDTLAVGRIRNNVSLVQDGVEALTFLRREGSYANAPRPDLILL